ncbi:MAG: adenosylmethionine decarboxylase [Thermodesulfobacteriota bacterium]|nr:adenosylmethionine decarboxylase [Thermodesulfobacteriota bacterium]
MEKSGWQDIGSHYLVELLSCNTEKLKRVALIKRILQNAVKLSNASVLGEVFHQFEPCGVTGVIVIGESHVAIHTWPEHNYCAFDFFSCAKNFEVEKTIHYVAKELEADDVQISRHSRGFFPKNIKEKFK